MSRYEKYEEATNHHWRQSYCLHEQSWRDYDELVSKFKWTVPATFNIAAHVCDRWAGSERRALVAITDDATTEVTFARLQERANQFANYLVDSGIGRGDCVAVHGSQREEVLVAHLAVWKIGAVSMPLSGRMDADELEFRLRDAEAQAFVATANGIDELREVEDDLPELDRRIVVDVDPDDGEQNFTAAIDSYSTSFTTTEVPSTHPAFIVYTSGTTGTPKGVVLPHQHLLGVLPTALCGVFNMSVSSEDVLRVPIEWAWIGSFNAVVLPGLFYGVTVVAADVDRFHPKRELGMVEEHGVTLLGGPPELFEVLFDYPGVHSADLETVRVVGFGGGVPSESLFSRARKVLPDEAAVHSVYGQSEAPMVVTDCESLGVDHRPDKMGRPGPGHDVTVLDRETQCPVEPGTLGEIALRTANNPLPFTEYRENPEKTAKKVTDGTLLTEDLGSIDNDGYIEFFCRDDDLIRSDSAPVDPGTVESALESHRAVEDAGVVGIPEGTADQQLTAFVALNAVYDPDAAFSEKFYQFVRDLGVFIMLRGSLVDGDRVRAEIRELIRQIGSVVTDSTDRNAELETELRDHMIDPLDDYERPHDIKFIESLPKTNTRKIRRHNLRERTEVTTT